MTVSLVDKIKLLNSDFSIKDEFTISFSKNIEIKIEVEDETFTDNNDLFHEENIEEAEYLGVTEEITPVIKPKTKVNNYNKDFYYRNYTATMTVM